MYEGKRQRIFTQNDSKYHSASRYLNNLNQVQSYLSVKIKKSRRFAESRPVEGQNYALLTPVQYTLTIKLRRKQTRTSVI